MTDDFKKKILDYFASNYGIESGNNIPQFSEIEQKTNNLYTQLADEIGIQSGGGVYIELLGEIQSNTIDNNGGLFTILYGNSYNQKYGGNNYGWIALIDSEFNLIQIITEYASGTIIGTIHTLNVDEKGLLYGIETSYDTGNKRFVMLNNVAVKLPTEQDYSLILRQSYNLPNDIKNYDYKLVKKAPNQSKYALGGLRHNPQSSYANYNIPVLTELTINVGTENEWVTYDVNNQFDDNDYTISDLYATWTNDELYFQMTGSKNTETSAFCVYYLSTEKINLTIIQMPNEMQYNYSVINSKIFNSFEYYIFAYRETLDRRYYIIYQWNNGTIKTIYNQDNVFRAIGDPSGIGVRIWGDDIYFYDIQYNGTNYTCHMGRIIDDKVYYTTIENVDLFTRAGFQLFMVNKQFNLYKFSFQGQDINYNSTQIYNFYNYNGVEYQNIDSMIPNSSLLYDENDKIIFARNLYNKVINNNTTTSTLQIPNNFVNDITISKQQLIGETNTTLNENYKDIITNIYEVLNINFYNTLIMKNENDPNNVIINNIGASRLNNSISNLADYNDAKMGKYRINYTDNTNRIIENIWSPIGNFYRTNINVYVNKEIQSIDFISQDENTIYCSINPILEIGNIYKIKQDVYIDEKMQPNEVYYGVDEVFYNDEKVYY